MADGLLLRPGAGVAADLAELLNRVTEADGLADYAPRYTAEEVEREWLGYPGYSPEDAAGYVLGNRLAGFAYAWSEAGRGRINIYVDPYLPLQDRCRAARALLSWARARLERLRVQRVEVYAGPYMSPGFQLLYSLLGWASVRLTSFLMKLETRPQRVRAPAGLELEHVRRLLRSHVEAVVEVFNDAFSDYGPEWRWSLERAEHYYRVLFSSSNRYPVLILARLDNTVAGFVEAYGFTSLSGKRGCYVSLLAVRRGYRGLGVGSYLLATAIDVLEKGFGCDHVFLDSLPKPMKLYMQLGFRVVKAYARLAGLVSELPSSLDGLAAIGNTWKED